MRRAPTLIGLALLAAAIGWRLGGGAAPAPRPLAQAAVDEEVEIAPLRDAPAVDRSPVAAPADARPRTFEGFVDALVSLGVRTWAAIEDDDESTAIELDEATREQIVALRQSVDASEEKALHALSGLLSEDTTLPGRVRRKVLLTIVEIGLRARWQRHGYGDSRDASDRFVSAMLATLPQDEVLARELGLDILADAPFLGAAHETAVLAIVEAAAAEDFLAEVAEALLRTLWQNLEQNGDRSSAELASFALLLVDDANPSRRLAALRHLLTADGGRFESYVVDLVVRRGEHELAPAIATTAATSLPPDRALGVLERLASVGDASTTAAFLMLGQRSPDTLRTAYEQKLADRIAPHVRAELVTGAGFRGDAVDVARLAFDLDPDPEVRARALFVLSAQAEPNVAERKLLEALDDPRFADRPDRVGAVVSALGNLAQSGEVNAVDRIGRRLLTHPQLTDADRSRVQELLARYTPR